jgi:hypothetical protein
MNINVNVNIPVVELGEVVPVVVVVVVVVVAVPDTEYVKMLPQTNKSTKADIPSNKVNCMLRM